MSVDLFRRRADECRRLAAAASTPSDRAFWLGLVARWQALESQNVWEPGRAKSRSPLSPKLQVIDNPRRPNFSKVHARYHSRKRVALTLVADSVSPTVAPRPRSVPPS